MKKRINFADREFAVREAFEALLAPLPPPSGSNEKGVNSSSEFDIEGLRCLLYQRNGKKRIKYPGFSQVT